MNLLKNTPSKFQAVLATAALAFGCSLAAASPALHRTTIQLMDESEANTLISQVDAQMLTAKDRADQLKLFSEYPEAYAKEDYAIHLNELKAAVNKAQQDLDRVEAMRAQLSPMQVVTAAKLATQLNKVATDTEETIKIFNREGTPARLVNSDFSQDIAAIYQAADDSHRIARDYLTWDRDSSRSKQALRDLEQVE